MRAFPYDELELIVFDQLVTPVAYYLSRAEVEAWFAGDSFTDVALRWHNQMSWTATATVKRLTPAAPQKFGKNEIRTTNGGR